MVYTRKRKYDEEELIEKKKSRFISVRIGSSNSIKEKFSTRSNRVLNKSNLSSTPIKSKKSENISSIKEYKKKNGKIIKVEVRKETKYCNESSNDSGIFLNNSVDMSCNSSTLSNNSTCDENECHESSINNKQHDFKNLCLGKNLKTLQVVLVRMENIDKKFTDQTNLLSSKQRKDSNANLGLPKYTGPHSTTNLNLHPQTKTKDNSQGKKMSSKANLHTVGYKSKDAKKSSCSRTKNSALKCQVENLNIATRNRNLNAVKKTGRSNISKVAKLESIEHSDEFENSDTSNKVKVSKDCNTAKDFKTKTINKLEHSNASNMLQTSRDAKKLVNSSSVTNKIDMAEVSGKRKNSKTASKSKILVSAAKFDIPNNIKDFKKSSQDENLKILSIKKCSGTTDKLKTSSVVNKLEDDSNQIQNSKVWNLVNEFENKSTIMQGYSNITNDDDHKELNLSDESKSSDSEWEEVEEKAEQNLEDYKPDILHQGVEITIAYNDRKKEKRRLKRERELEEARLNVNKIRRNNQLFVHKVHLLCLLARGFHLNKILNSPVVKAMALSFIPNEIISKTSGKKVEKINVGSLRDIMLWFCKSFSYASESGFFTNIFLNIVRSFQNKTAVNISYYNLMFIAIARVLGFKARFCMSLYPVSFKAQNLLKPKRNVEKASVKSENDDCQEKSNIEVAKKVSVQTKKPSKDTIKNKQSNCLKKSPRIRKSVKKSYKISDDETDDSFKDEDFIASDSSDEESDIEDYGSSRKTKQSEPIHPKTMVNNSTGENKSKFKPRKQRKNLTEKNLDTFDDESDVDDFMPVKSKRNIKCNTKKTQKKRKISSEHNNYSYDFFYKSDKIICWTEIFSKADRRWISIDCVNKVIGNSYEFEALAHQPVSYVIAYDNDSYVKDVTSRYCSEFMIVTRKLRVVSEWWTETIKPYCPPRSKINMEEDDEMDMTLIHKPIPQTLAGLKDHPLYALKRHLLKFEALYPPDAAPVGFLRGEPIYPRDCVVKLQSREKWFKNSRVVRPGEEPYKITTHLTWDKINRVILKDVPLELFGFWQTDPYQPPVAKDGKIPRNEYGNVELFRGNMLPVGTVHIQIPGINRVAQKLDIDCSPAVVGFELTKGHIRPKFDGFVVCEEFKDTLMNAWEEEQKLAKKRQREKNEKRIYGNWKKLIRGLLIRERLKKKYHLN